MGRRLGAVLAGCALLLAGCGSSGDDAQTGRSADDPTAVLPASATGLLLVDCWHDTITELSPTDAKLATSYLFSAEPSDGATTERLCGWGSVAGSSGLDPYSPDGTLLTASTAGADDSTHVGFVTVGDGVFVDVSARMPFDANGHFVDKGSAADAFAGPIKDDGLGFEPDGTFYLTRAGVRYAAAAPAYDAFEPLDDSELIALPSPDGSRSVSTSRYGAVISLPAGTPAVDGDDMNPGFAGLAVDDDGVVPLECDGVEWIDADHLLCRRSPRPTLVTLTGSTLRATAELDTEGDSQACYQRSYIELLPAGAQTPLTPQSSRELFGFRADPSAGVVYFLADNGTTMQLYAATVQPGSVPTLLGEIAVGDDPAGSSWLDLMVR